MSVGPAIWNEPWQDKIVLVNKPLKWTSFDVVNKLKYTWKLKTGHAGTLDPLGSGLLILCTGTKLKEMEQFKELDKSYSCSMVLGATTPSIDLETEIDQRFSIENISFEMIESTAKKFIGESLQIPPIHSASKKDGVRYYKMARRGEEVTPLPKMVELKSLIITKIDLPEIHFELTCSKGFYVRSFVNDFGKALNNGAYLSSLCRTQIGNYKLVEANEIETLCSDIKTTRDNYYKSLPVIHPQ